MTLVCPSTPTLPSSSQQSSSSSSFLSPTTPTSSARRIHTYQTGYSTPPSSPPPPVTPSSHRGGGSRKTLHLISPSKPTRAIVPAPLASGPAAATVRLTPGSRTRSQLTVRGNVTPSRASAFFAPRPRRQQQQPRGIDSSPSSPFSHTYTYTLSSPCSIGNTSARRGPKRSRDGAVIQSHSRSDRILLDSSYQDTTLQGSSTAAIIRNRTLADQPLFMMSDSDDSEDDAFADFDDDDHGYDSLSRLRTARSFRASSPSAYRSAGSPSQSAYCSARTPSRPAALESLSGSASPSPRKPVPMAMRNQGSTSNAGHTSLSAALARMRCVPGAGRHGSALTAMRRQIPQAPYLSSFASDSTSGVYRIASSDPDAPSTQPLCAKYAYSAKSYGATRQWLAVGDNEGGLTLVDTARDLTQDTYDDSDMYDGENKQRPAWEASPGSVFSVAWRFDDRFLATSGSDYQIKIFDTSTASQVHTFSGARRTARSVEWDPFGQGQLMASAGRDGGVHVWDLRMQNCKGEPCQSTGPSGYDEEDVLDEEPIPPLLSLWSAHTAPAALRARNSRHHRKPRGVTSLVYHPHVEHCVFTAGCADANIKGWDLRFAIEPKSGRDLEGLSAAGKGLSSLTGKDENRVPFRDMSNLIDQESDYARAGTKRKMRKPRKIQPGEASFVLNPAGLNDHGEYDDREHGNLGQEEHPLPIVPFAQTGDLSTTVGRSWNKRSHGISSLCIGGRGHSLFAACTDGRIYQTPLSTLTPDSLTDSLSLPPLFHSTQLGNSLYNHISLSPDEKTLAIGCNNGSILLWDTNLRQGSITGGKGRHQVNCEINALDWCYDAYSGCKLATASDDRTVRTWEGDRGLAEAEAEAV
ncbi:unnamed protein product [Sympodiomycopsis kandeliae]